MSCLIREAHAGDQDRLLDMAQRFLLATPFGKWITPSRSQLEAFGEQLKMLGPVFVAEVDGYVIGMIAMAGYSHPIDGQAEAGEIAWWIDPAHRGGSAALRLLAKFEEWSKKYAKDRQINRIRVKMVAPTENPVVGIVLKRAGYVALETSFYKWVDA